MSTVTMMQPHTNQTDMSPPITPLSHLRSAVLEGVEAKVIEVEASFTKGLPGFALVGLASSEIQEAKERVRSALLTNGFVFPPLKITINLSPSDLKKSGTHLDLAIALLIYSNDTPLGVDEKTYVFGELGLDGKVKTSSQLFPTVLSLKEQGLIEQAIVPKEAMEGLSYIPSVRFIAVESLQEAIEVLSNDRLSPPLTHDQTAISAQKLSIKQKTFYYQTDYTYDFADVKGQRVAKRAALIASAGMHNFLMEGNPGSGKSMIAKRLREILPPLQEHEILAIAKHRYLEGKKPDFAPLRPFRSPHHTATTASIFGGGSGQSAKIGEVALAHLGILFFDELPHFPKQILEALREPLQDRKVHIARVNAKIEYPSDIMFVAAMNPCPCGNLLSQTKTCRCTDAEIKRYKNRLSDPFLDRIDLFVTMQEVEFNDRSDIDSHTMHQMVIEAFKRQKQRAQTHLNGKLNEQEIEQFCKLERDAQEILQKAIRNFSLSHRAIASIKKVARTVADLNGSDTIDKKALLEALSYRKRDR